MILQILFTKIEKYQFRAAATLVVIKEIYQKCVNNSGIVGSSVHTVDNGEE